MTQKPFISIIIPAFNSQKYIGRCLDSLSKQNYPKDRMEIVIVDNGSTDNTLNIIRNYTVKLLSLPRGKRISQVRNWGAKEAQGEILAFIDSDCIAPAHWLEKSIEFLNQSGVGAVGCWYQLPSDAVFIEKVWDVNSQMRRETPGKTQWLPSSNFIVSKPVFNRINGFDESLITAEDVDISERIKTLGLSLFSHPDVAVIHLDNPKTLPAFLWKEKWRGEGVIQTALRDFPHIKWNKAILFTIISMFFFLGFLGGLGIVLIEGEPLWLEICILGILFIPVCLALKAVYSTKRWSYLLPLIFLFTAYAFARILSLFNFKIWKKTNDKKT